MTRRRGARSQGQVEGEVLQDLGRHVDWRGRWPRPVGRWSRKAPGGPGAEAVAGRLLADSNWHRQTWWPPSRPPTTYDLRRRAATRTRTTRHTPCATPVPRGWSRKESRSTGLAPPRPRELPDHQRYAHLQPDAHKAVLGAWERLDVPLHHRRMNDPPALSLHGRGRRPFTLIQGCRATSSSGRRPASPFAVERPGMGVEIALKEFAQSLTAGRGIRRESPVARTVDQSGLPYASAHCSHSSSSAAAGRAVGSRAGCAARRRGSRRPTLCLHLLDQDFRSMSLDLPLPGPAQQPRTSGVAARTCGVLLPAAGVRPTAARWFEIMQKVPQTGLQWSTVRCPCRCTGNAGTSFWQAHRVPGVPANSWSYLGIRVRDCVAVGGSPLSGRLVWHTSVKSAL